MRPANPAPADRRGRDLRAIFAPRRVAIVGASARPGSPGHTLWRNLRTFPGEVVPVSRSAAEIDGVPTFPDLTSVPGRVDLAVVAVPAADVVDVVSDAAASGVGACIVISSGFAEVGAEGAARQERIVAAGRAAGMLIAGPNCLGVQNLSIPLNASLAAGTAAGGSGISVVTQSGSYAMALHAMSQDEGVQFAAAYSSGNRADVDDFEVIGHLAADPDTRVTCVFAESIADGRSLVETLRRTTPTTPVVIALTGRSEAGARSAASHTAAVVGSRRAWDDVLRTAGAVVARSGLEMLDIARALSEQPWPAGRRAAIVTNSGGTGTELADLLSAAGVELPALSSRLRDQLASLLPAYASTGNPVDLTPVWARYAELYPAVVDLLARSGEVDLIVPVLLHRSAEDPAVVDALVDAVRQLRADENATPVYVCWVARRSAWAGSEPLRAAGIPCFEWPERTARAVGGAVQHGTRSAVDVVSRPVPRRLPHAVGRDLPATDRFLRRHGIPVAASALSRTAQAAVAGAARFPGPVVLKVEHPDLLHRSDSGGVRVGLTTAEDIEQAALELLALAPGAQIRVQAVHVGVELMVGGVNDPVLGPIVGLGLGGVLVELLDDVGFVPAPVTEHDAYGLLRRPRIARLLQGYRGGAVADPQPIVLALRAVGSLIAGYPEIGELDLNPLLAGPDGCVAVDVRLVRR